MVLFHINKYKEISLSGCHFTSCLTCNVIGCCHKKSVQPFSWVFQPQSLESMACINSNGLKSLGWCHAYFLYWGRELQNYLMIPLFFFVEIYNCKTIPNAFSWLLMLFSNILHHFDFLALACSALFWLYPLCTAQKEEELCSDDVCVHSLSYHDTTDFCLEATLLKLIVHVKCTSSFTLRTVCPLL